jgi:hypothetical protein
MTAASRQSGVEGTDGSVGLKVMPIDSVTISDAHDPGERAPTPIWTDCDYLAMRSATTHIRLFGLGS